MSLNDWRELVDGVGRMFAAVGNRFDELLGWTNQRLNKMTAMAAESRSTFQFLGDQVQLCHRNTLALRDGNESHTQWAEAVSKFFGRQEKNC